MNIKGFWCRKDAESYQKENGGVLLFGQWSGKRAAFTETGKAYHKALVEAHIPLEDWSSKYSYIVVER